MRSTNEHVRRSWISEKSKICSREARFQNPWPETEPRGRVCIDDSPQDEENQDISRSPRSGSQARFLGSPEGRNDDNTPTYNEELDEKSDIDLGTPKHSPQNCARIGVHVPYQTNNTPSTQHSPKQRAGKRPAHVIEQEDSQSSTNQIRENTSSQRKRKKTQKRSHSSEGAKEKTLDDGMQLKQSTQGLSSKTVPVKTYAAAASVIPNNPGVLRCLRPPSNGDMRHSKAFPAQILRKRKRPLVQGLQRNGDKKQSKYSQRRISDDLFHVYNKSQPLSQQIRRSRGRLTAAKVMQSKVVAKTHSQPPSCNRSKPHTRKVDYISQRIKASKRAKGCALTSTEQSLGFHPKRKRNTDALGADNNQWYIRGSGKRSRSDIPIDDTSMSLSENIDIDENKHDVAEDSAQPEGSPRDNRHTRRSGLCSLKNHTH